MLRRIKQPTFAELFAPKLITVLREGYDFADFRADVISGLTVAIVALPLSMAIAIASGVTPDRGLYTAVIGGFIVSLLGGSRFQIGGPAGAFIVLVALTVERHGVDGVILATTMAGVFLIAAGLLRLGTYIKFIPYPVTVGFTAGIAVIIFASQLKDLFGFTLTAKEPGELMPKLEALAHGLHTVNFSAVAVAAVCIAIIIALRELRPHWPGILIAVVVAALATWVLSLPVETIGTRFSGIPRQLPWPAWPPFSLEKARAVLPDAIAFALLGAIESLLSAVVAADGMTGRRHRSNCELVAQGFANIGSALFGGICVTGTIARTATNVRAGARGPVSGMLHSLFLLLFMLIAAPLASYIPLAALASVLVIVAWNMAEKHEFATNPLVARRCHRTACHISADDLSRSHRGHPGRLRAWCGVVHQPHGADDGHRGRDAAGNCRPGRRRRWRSGPLRFPSCRRSGRAGVPHHRSFLLRRGIDGGDRA
jgi:SulP family sulfate permease